MKHQAVKAVNLYISKDEDIGLDSSIELDID